MGVVTTRNHRDRRWMRVRRVIADGRDVTRYCWKYDRRRRRVWLYLRDMSGNILIHPDMTRTIQYERRVRRLEVQMPRTKKLSA